MTRVRIPVGALLSPSSRRIRHEAIQEAEEATRRVVEMGARTKEAAERGINEMTSALMAWAARHGVNVDDTRDAQS